MLDPWAYPLYANMHFLGYLPIAHGMQLTLEAQAAVCIQHTAQQFLQPGQQAFSGLAIAHGMQLTLEAQASVSHPTHCAADFASC